MPNSFSLILPYTYFYILFQTGSYTVGLKITIVKAHPGFLNPPASTFKILTISGVTPRLAPKLFLSTSFSRSDHLSVIIKDVLGELRLEAGTGRRATLLAICF